MGRKRSPELQAYLDAKLTYLRTLRQLRDVVDGEIREVVFDLRYPGLRARVEAVAPVWL
jgi:hypothetical protein